MQVLLEACQLDQPASLNNSFRFRLRCLQNINLACVIAADAKPLWLVKRVPQESRGRQHRARGCAAPGSGLQNAPPGLASRVQCDCHRRLQQPVHVRCQVRQPDAGVAVGPSYNITFRLFSLQPEMTDESDSSSNSRLLLCLLVSAPKAGAISECRHTVTAKQPAPLSLPPANPPAQPAANRFADARQHRQRFQQRTACTPCLYGSMAPQASCDDWCHLPQPQQDHSQAGRASELGRFSCLEQGQPVKPP